MSRKFFLSIIASCLLYTDFCFSQDTLSFFQPSPAYNKARIKILSYSLAGTYALSMTGLYHLWYKDFDSEPFHFFDDNPEWMQFDKIGHLGSAYYLGKWGIGLFQWTGMENKKATWIGGMAGFAFLTSVEVMDGFSSAWGFSWSDMAYNAAGTGMVISQQLLWNEQRINLKFSYHESKFAQYRPDQFGTGITEKVFKDYNGSSVWLSANIYSFIRNKESKFPKWLNVAGGYGVEGLTGARENVSEFNGKPVPPFARYRQFYISPDIDLTRINTRSKILKTIFGAFGFIKIPAPAIEFNRVDDVKWHWLYY